MKWCSPEVPDGSGSFSGGEWQPGHELLGDREGSGRRGARGVEHVQRTCALLKPEVLDERSIAMHRLGPDARTARQQIARGESRDQFLQITAREFTAHGAQ